MFRYLRYINPKPNHDPRKRLVVFDYDKFDTTEIEKNENDPIDLSCEDLLLLFPNTFSEKVDYALLSIASSLPGYSSKICFEEADSPTFVEACMMCSILERDSKLAREELFGFLDLLTEMGYLDKANNTYRLTAKAWLRVQELGQNNKISKQAFVAMSFDTDMKTVRDTIIASVRESGYSPMLIDTKEHNNQIVPEIFFEIKRSLFVVADLTKHRNGVYYEAGYAEALGKEVILCCEKSDFDNKHFDVAQKNTIVWEDENDLLKRLKDRIKATI